MICAPLRALDYAYALPQPTVTSSRPVTLGRAEVLPGRLDHGII